MTAPSNTLQLNVSGGVDSCSGSRHFIIQTLYPENKVCRTLTMREERIGLHEKRILPNTLHGSALRYTTDQKETLFSGPLILLPCFDLIFGLGFLNRAGLFNLMGS